MKAAVLIFQLLSSAHELAPKVPYIQSTPWDPKEPLFFYLSFVIIFKDLRQDEGVNNEYRPNSCRIITNENGRYPTLLIYSEQPRMFSNALTASITSAASS